MKLSEQFTAKIGELKTYLSGVKEVPSEVKTVIEQIGSVFDDAMAKVISFGEENKTKREANAELETANRTLTETNETLTTEVKGLKGDGTTKEKIESLETQLKTYQENDRTELLSVFKKVGLHENFVKVADEFPLIKLNDAKDEVVIDEKAFTTEIATEYGKALKPYQKAELFGTIQKKKVSESSTIIDPKDKSKDKVGTESDLLARQAALLESDTEPL